MAVSTQRHRSGAPGQRAAACLLHPIRPPQALRPRRPARRDAGRLGHHRIHSGHPLGHPHGSVSTAAAGVGEPATRSARHARRPDARRPDRRIPDRRRGGDRGRAAYDHCERLRRKRSIYRSSVAHRSPAPRRAGIVSSRSVSRMVAYCRSRSCPAPRRPRRVRRPRSLASSIRSSWIRQAGRFGWWRTPLVRAPAC